ncbi:MAG: hypothetical protein Q7S94_11090, partial [Gallionella sp.]|nr:hypothetical protein [Gallionella sp.]
APKGGDKELPGLAGGPIPGIDVKLGSPGGNPGGNGIMATLNSSGAIVAAEAIASSKTDSQGNFRFEKMPAGDYELKFPGLPAQSLTVGEDGIAAGSVKRGSDGSISIFDRWGKSFTAPPPKAGNAKQGTPDQTSKAAESPVGFGSGNHTMGAGPGAGLGAGPGMIPSGATMGGAGGPGPMSPMGAGPMGGGPGGAMRP